MQMFKNPVFYFAEKRTPCPSGNVQGISTIMRIKVYQLKFNIKYSIVKMFCKEVFSPAFWNGLLHFMWIFHEHLKKRLLIFIHNNFRSN